MDIKESKQFVIARDEPVNPFKRYLNNRMFALIEGADPYDWEEEELLKFDSVDEAIKYMLDNYEDLGSTWGYIHIIPTIDWEGTQTDIKNYNKCEYCFHKLTLKTQYYYISTDWEGNQYIEQPCIWCQPEYVWCDGELTQKEYEEKYSSGDPYCTNCQIRNRYTELEKFVKYRKTIVWNK